VAYIEGLVGWRVISYIVVVVRRIKLGTQQCNMHRVASKSGSSFSGMSFAILISCAIYDMKLVVISFMVTRYCFHLHGIVFMI